MNINININDNIFVELNITGKKLYKKYLKKYYPNSKMENKKRYKFQLWELFNIFGTNMTMHNPTPFVENKIHLMEN